MSSRALRMLSLAGALLGGGCVDEVLVGVQRGLVPAPDAAEPEAGEPEPETDAQAPAFDAGGGSEDAQAPRDAARLDAADPPDTQAPGPEASDDDGGPVLILDTTLEDGGCDAASCARDAAAEAGPLGACYACDVVVLLQPNADATCANGLDRVCWQNPDGGCSEQCPEVASCGQSSDCSAQEYCYFPKRDCGAGARGWCAPKPQGSCPGIGNPVCGCDAENYANACHAAQAGVSFADAVHAHCR